MPVHSLGQWRTGAIRRDIKRPGPGGLTEAIASAARRACAGARACAQAPSVMLALTGARGPLELFVGQGPCGHGWRRGQAQARDARAAAGPLGGPGLLLAEDRRPWYLASAGRLGHADPQRRAPTGSHSLSAPDTGTATRGPGPMPVAAERQPRAGGSAERGAYGPARQRAVSCSSLGS